VQVKDEKLRYALNLGFVGFATSFGAHIVAVNLPIYAEQVGIGVAVIGVLIAAYDFAEIIAKPRFGVGADRQGMKRTMLAGILFFTFASLTYLIVDPRWLILVRFVQGVGVAALSAVSLALIGDYYQQHRGRAYGLYNAIKGLGYVVSPLVGGAIILASNFATIFLAPTPAHTIRVWLLLGAASIIAYPFVDGILLVLTSIMAGIGVGTVWTNTDTTISQLAKAGNLGATMGAAGSFKEFGEMIGPLLVGVLSQALGLPLGFAICGVFGLGALLLVIRRTPASIKAAAVQGKPPRSWKRKDNTPHPFPLLFLNYSDLWLIITPVAGTIYCALDKVTRARSQETRSVSSFVLSTRQNYWLKVLIGECRLSEKGSVLQFETDMTLFHTEIGRRRQIGVRLWIGKTYLCRFVKVEKEKTSQK
jgi:MFS family permease